MHGDGGIGMRSYKDLQIELEELMVKIELARKVEASGLIMEIREKIGEYKLEPKDLFPLLDKARRSGGRSRRAPKYMHPQTGATWSGCGRPPRWILEADNKEEFRLPQEKMN